MPTTPSSNNPHVRITPETHQRIRVLSVFTGYSQGDLVDMLVTARLEELGNPHHTLVLPPRQRRVPGKVKGTQVAQRASPVNRTAATRRPPEPVRESRRVARLPPPEPVPIRKGRRPDPPMRDPTPAPPKRRK